VPERRVSREETIDGYIALFRQAVRRRLPADGNFAVPLSGGRDSRHILFELVAAGSRPRFCITTRYFFDRPNQEVEIAVRTAKSVGIPHVLLSQPGSRLAAEIRKNLLTSFCAWEHAWALPVADYLNGTVDVIYDGLGGDALSGGATLRPKRLALYAAGRFAEFCDTRFTTREQHLRGLLTPSLYRRWSRERALDRMISELRRHVEAANPIGSFHFWNKARRETALLPCGIHAHVRTVFCPYLDHELYDFLASLPATMFADRTFHTETIRRAFPHYAGVPFEDRDVPTPRNPAPVRQFARELASYILRHGHSDIVRPEFLFPRLLRRILDGSEYAGGPLYLFAIYLLQLEKRRRTSRATLGSSRAT
jgi:asparagine synthetase B (glutamine-hydrolysing)